MFAKHDLGTYISSLDSSAIQRTAELARGKDLELLTHFWTHVALNMTGASKAWRPSSDTIEATLRVCLQLLDSTHINL